MLAETGGGAWSWVEVMGAGWRRVDLGGDEWSWVELGEQFSITRFIELHRLIKSIIKCN